MKKLYFILASSLTFSACINNPTITFNPQNNVTSSNSTVVKANYQNLSPAAQAALITPRLKDIPFLKGENVVVPVRSDVETQPARLQTPDQAANPTAFTGDLKIHLNALENTLSGLQKSDDVAAYQVAIMTPTILQLNDGQPLVKQIPPTERAIVFESVPAEPADILIRPLNQNMEPIATLRNEDMLISPGQVSKLNAEFTLLHPPTAPDNSGPLELPTQVQVSMVSTNGQELRQQSDMIAQGGSVTYSDTTTPLPPLASNNPPSPPSQPSCSGGAPDYSNSPSTTYVQDDVLSANITLPTSFNGMSALFNEEVSASSNNFLSILFKGISIEKDLNLAVISGASACDNSTQITPYPGVTVKETTEAVSFAPSAMDQHELDAKIDELVQTDGFPPDISSMFPGNGLIDSALNASNAQEKPISSAQGETISAEPSQTPGNPNIVVNVNESTSSQKVQEKVSQNNAIAQTVSQSPSKPTLKRLTFTTSTLQLTPNNKDFDLNRYLDKVFSDGKSHTEYPMTWTSSTRSVAIVNAQGKLNTIGVGKTTITVSLPDYPNITASFQIVVSNQNSSSSSTSSQSSGSSTAQYVAPTGSFILSKYSAEVGETITITPQDLKGSYSKINFNLGALGSFTTSGTPVQVKVSQSGTFRAYMSLIDTQNKTHTGYPSSGHLLGVKAKAETKKIDVSPSSYSWQNNVQKDSNGKTLWEVSLGALITPRALENQFIVEVKREDGKKFANGGIIQYFINDKLILHTDYPRDASTIPRSISANYLSKSPAPNILNIVLHSYNPDNKSTSVLKTGPVKLTKYY